MKINLIARGNSVLCAKMRQVYGRTASFEKTGILNKDNRFPAETMVVHQRLKIGRRYCGIKQGEGGHST